MAGSASTPIPLPRFCEMCGYPDDECAREGCPKPFADPTYDEMARTRRLFHVLLMYAIARLNEVTTAPEGEGRALAHQSAREIWKALRKAEPL